MRGWRSPLPPLSFFFFFLCCWFVVLCQFRLFLNFLLQFLAGFRYPLGSVPPLSFVMGRTSSSLVTPMGPRLRPVHFSTIIWTLSRSPPQARHKAPLPLSINDLLLETCCLQQQGFFFPGFPLRLPQPGLLMPFSLTLFG